MTNVQSVDQCQCWCDLCADAALDLICDYYGLVVPLLVAAFPFRKTFKKQLKVFQVIKCNG
jgi:hypothetical protein